MSGTTNPLQFPIPEEADAMMATTGTSLSQFESSGLGNGPKKPQTDCKNNDATGGLLQAPLHRIHVSDPPMTAAGSDSTSSTASLLSSTSSTVSTTIPTVVPSLSSTPSTSSLVVVAS